MTRVPEDRSDADRTAAQRWALQSMGVTIWESRAAQLEPESRPAAETHAPTPEQAAPPAPPEQEDEIREFRAPEPELDPGDGEPEDVSGMDWQALRAAVAHCSRCPLHQSRTQGVFGTGDEAARWMIIGEAPGVEEDRRGEPFVGRAGQLLDELLRAVGMDRSQVFIANMLKSRPPENRDPHEDEIRACTPFLERQIELVKPELILAVGRIAAQHLLASQDAVGRLRGKVHSYGRAAIPLVVTYHPAYLLRQPSAKGKVWQDLKLAQRTAAGR